MEGIGYDFLPTVFDRDVVDVWYKCNDKEAIPLARRLHREEGILSGASSGTALAVALKAAKKLQKGEVCVVLLPDGIRNYMTKMVSDNWCEARGFKETANEFNHWWWNHEVSSLNVAESLAIPSTASCQEALALMKEMHVDQAIVITDK